MISVVTTIWCDKCYYKESRSYSKESFWRELQAKGWSSLGVGDYYTKHFCPRCSLEMSRKEGTHE